MFDLWNRFHAFPASDEASIRRELLWNNKFININGNLPQWKVCISKDITPVNDICHQREGRLLSHTEIADRYKVRCTFLDTLQLRLSIPLNWRQALSDSWTEPPRPTSISGIDILLPGSEPSDVSSSGSKAMYGALVSKPDSQSTAFRSWSGMDGSPLQIESMEEWKEINLSIYRATRETKLQSLHFKTLNRVLPCNQFLKQIRIKESDACDLCGESDTILHFLLECPTVRTFWNAVCAWFDRVEDLPLGVLTPKQYIFGLPRSIPKAVVANFIVISTKFFVYRQRLFHGGSLELLHWLREFKLNILSEKYIHQSEGKANRFRKWERILTALG